jgi:formylmethanofuran dehydrogenase subunit E
MNILSRRRFATQAAATLAGTAALQAHDEHDNPTLDRVALIHGGTGPFAIAGYRMGEAALKQLKVGRGSPDLEVIHHSPREVQWSCIIDGLQAATGASLGKLNLSLVDAPAGTVFSVIRHRKTGQEVKLELTPAFVKQHSNLPMTQTAAAGARVAVSAETEIFRSIR